MISVTRLDGKTLYINEKNIQWIEELPDVSITFIGGARLLVRDKLEALLEKIQKSTHNSLSEVYENNLSSILPTTCDLNMN